MPTTELLQEELRATAAETLHVIVWEFEARPGAVEKFVKAYGPDGDWAELFGHSPEFLRLELVQSVQHPNRFYTFDHWVSSAAFDTFCDVNEQAYKALDKQLAGLTAWERRIGAFPTSEAR